VREGQSSSEILETRACTEFFSGAKLLDTARNICAPGVWIRIGDRGFVSTRRFADAGDYARRVAADDDPVLSAANLMETSIVLRGLKKIAPAKAERCLDDFMKATGIRIEPVTAD
jgi:hypothetical protein